MVSNKSLFYLFFILVTFVFSLIGNTQTDVVIVGPDFEQQDYFIEELEAISIKTGYKITYIPLNDVHAYLNNNLNSSLACYDQYKLFSNRQPFVLREQ